MGLTFDDYMNMRSAGKSSTRVPVVDNRISTAGSSNGLTVDKFLEMKAAGGIRWNTDRLQKDADEVRNYISSVSDQSQFKGNLWTDDEYNNNKAQAAGMRNRLRALEVYANSIKDKDEGAYRNAMSIHSDLSDALDQVDDWFSNSWKDNKLSAALGNIKKGSTAKEQAAALGLDEKELETAYKEQLDYENEQELDAKYGKMNTEQLLAELKKSENIATDLIESVRNFFHSGNRIRYQRIKDIGIIREKRISEAGIDHEFISVYIDFLI